MSSRPAVPLQTHLEASEVRIPVTALLVVAAMLIGTYFYHPYYFGDELFSFNAAPGDGFGETFQALNEYKPRLLMNIVWSAIVAFNLPRWVPMLLVAGSIGAGSALFYHLVREVFGARHRDALIGAGLLLFSRFDLMLYFDYVSGMVEALSLALFLAGLALLARPLLVGGTYRPNRQIILGCALWLLVVMVHERYIAAFAVFSGMLVLRAFASDRAGGVVRSLPLAIAITALPVLLYVGLVSGLSTTSVMTGTSGQEVTLGLGTLKVAASYVANVLLGSNFGPSWLTGHLNHLHPWHPTVFAISAVVGVIAYAWPWIWGRSVETSRLWTTLTLLLAALAMIFVASLPGADRQEARWMLPVLALVLMAVFATYRGVAATGVLVFMLASQLVYVTWGGLQTIASIRASQTAKALASTLSTLDVPGKQGVMLLAAEPDTSWVLGNDGSEFCRLNLSGTNCLLPKATAIKLEGKRIGFGVSSTATDLLETPRFRLVSGDLAELSLHPQQFSGGKALGDGKAWPNWMLGASARVTDHGLLVTGMGDNFLKVDAASLRDAMLVYRASSAADQRSQLRLQVNWHDAADRFLAAQIEVVDTTPQPGNFATLATLPENAAYGYVYATLHDGARIGVLIQSITVVEP